GASSVVYMFWRERGKAREALKQLQYGMPCYYKLTNGHGMGSPKAMEADLLLLEGDDDASEQICLETLRAAEGQKQDSIAFCAELALARIAVLRGDVDGFNKQLKNIRRRSFEGYEQSGTVTADMCRAFLSSLLDIEDGLPGWMHDMKSIQESIYLSAVPFAHISYARALMRSDTEEFNKLLNEFMALTEQLHMQLPKVYYLIYHAIVLERSGDRDGALEALGQALDTAVPDRVFMPFAEHGAELGKLLKIISKTYKDTRAIDEILKLSGRMLIGINKIKESVKSVGITLTRRERQVSLLIKQGLTTTRIAELLCISDGTVRVIKKNIYRKLEIHSKVELMQKRL
ncbi:MAG: LuxR C-terminal-related transcriptional regulator, partial [Synergistaceae bacterium]|nr:LuxR C-terminal-related transcriptional regulator [Synergistaceae bacterium]